MSELINIVALGLLEGLTEFIPVSSTGHLILLGDALGFTGEKAATFEIFIQLGAILAVVVLYWRKFLGFIDFRSRSNFEGLSGCKRLFCAILPVLVIGFVAHDFIKQHLFTPYSVALALIVGGLVMILVERFPRKPTVHSLEQISLRQAFIVGIFQCASLWSGMSRSGSTLVGGILTGLDRRTAAEFSFLVAVPVMFAATGYDLLKSFHLLSASDVIPFGVGFIVSFFSALAAIRFFIEFLKKYTLTGFAIYRILLGLAVLLLNSK